MRKLGLLIPVAAVSMLAACDPQAGSKLKALAHADSLRTDSLLKIKNDLLNEVMSSTQFVNDLNTEVAKLKSRKSSKLTPTASRESDITNVKEERANVVAKVRELVARLDSSEARVASLRARAARLSARDSTLVAQVAAYEKTIISLRQQVEQQQAQLAEVTQENVRLVGERAALTDTVTQLTAERNTVYYVIGTKDELIRDGILVEEGRKRFLLVGGRPVAPAR